MTCLKIEKTVLAKVCPVIAVLGLVFAADYFVMGRLIPEVAADYEKEISVACFISSLTYGGVVICLQHRCFLEE